MVSPGWSAGYDGRDRLNHRHRLDCKTLECQVGVRQRRCEIQSKPVRQQALIVERDRMHIVVGMIHCVVRSHDWAMAMPDVVRPRVQHRYADRDKVRDQRHRHDKSASESM